MKWQGWLGGALLGAFYLAVALWLLWWTDANANIDVFLVGWPLTLLCEGVSVWLFCNVAERRGWM